MSSFEDWLRADAAWFEANRSFLSEHVFQWFLRTGKWPEVGPLQHELYKAGDRATKVADISNSKPVIPGQFDPAIKQTISLQARHLVNFPEAATLMNLTVKAARAAVAIYLGTPAGEQSSITSADVETSTPGEKNTLKLLPEFVFTDHPTPFAGGGGDEFWTMGVYPELVMVFEDVGKPVEYVDRQFQIIEGWGHDYDERLKAFNQQTIDVVEEPDEAEGPKVDIPIVDGPFRAFIVMPFARKRSARVHKMIEEAIASFGGLVVAVRADQIADPGKITQQIVDELQTCAFIIADITGGNPNVAWELGYAYDHEKPCVILRCIRERKPAPFDIYDQRRTEYSNKPTADDRGRLIEMINRAIAQVRNKSTQGGLGHLFKES